jgi:6-phospho-3-hexuloisomerase
MTRATRLVKRPKNKQSAPSQTIQSTIEVVMKEIDAVLSLVDHTSVERLIKALRKGRRVVTIGAGRVGLTTKGFAMRLGHLGFAAYALGDMTVPSLGVKGDLVLIASGSGETPSIVLLAETAKKSGATLALLTGNPDSRMGRIADIIVHIPAPTKSSKGALQSAQPMTTLNEQCLQIFFDALVLLLMEELGESAETMWARHSNLE